VCVCVLCVRAYVRTCLKSFINSKRITCVYHPVVVFKAGYLIILLTSKLLMCLLMHSYILENGKCMCSPAVLTASLILLTSKLRINTVTYMYEPMHVHACSCSTPTCRSCKRLNVCTRPGCSRLASWHLGCYVGEASSYMDITS
jgi:hypothetical protein